MDECTIPKGELECLRIPPGFTFKKPSNCTKLELSILLDNMERINNVFFVSSVEKQPFITEKYVK